MRLIKLLTGFFALLRAFPEAICSRASAKKSSPLRGMANGLTGSLGFVRRLSFVCSLSFSQFGQGAPGASTVLIVDCSCPFVDDVFLDNVESLFELSDCADVELCIMNLHC